MNSLVLTALLAAVSLKHVATSPPPATLTGTCASINHSNSCCPPRTNCQAADGNCQCGADCNTFEDCCQDSHCPTQPRTCADVGITSCCNDVNGTGKCDVYFRDSQNNHCSCNMSCHQRNDCCSDAVSIGCVPRSCTEAGKSPGCCTSQCYVSAAGCYCDQLCTFYNDCCSDVSTTTCSMSDNQVSNSRMQSVYHKFRLARAIQGQQTEGKQHTAGSQNDIRTAAYFRRGISVQRQRERQ